MRQHILFLFGSQTCIPSDPLSAAKDLNCRTSVMSPNMPCGIEGELIDWYERINISLQEEIIDKVKKLHTLYPIDGVIGYDDQVSIIIAKIAHELRLPGLPLEAATAARDKYFMKQLLKSKGVPIAQFSLVHSEEEAIEWASHNGYPVVVKPCCGSASQGVIRADNSNELTDAFRRVRRIINAYRIGSEAGRIDTDVLIEEYLPGDEYSVELLFIDKIAHVLCVFEKPLPLDGPFFEETIYVSPPARLSITDLQKIQQLAVQTVEALGIDYGPVHCEIRGSSSNWFVLEIAARIIGGACSRVFRYVLGEDIHPIILKLALGQPITIPKQQPVAAGSMMLPIPEEGRLIKIRGLERINYIPNIQDVIISVEPNDIIIPFPEQSCYIGFLTAKGSTAQEVKNALLDASKEISFELEALECEPWHRNIEEYRFRKFPDKHSIKTLEQLEIEDAIDTVLPIISSTSFGEYPEELASEKGLHSIKWLLDGNLGETSPAFWLVAENYGVVLGSYRGDICYISSLGVHPSYRGNGLAKVLIEYIMILFAKRGCNQIEVFVDPHNPGGLNLFKKLKFIPKKLDGKQSCCQCEC